MEEEKTYIYKLKSNDKRYLNTSINSEGKMDFILEKSYRFFLSEEDHLKISNNTYSSNDKIYIDGEDGEIDKWTIRLSDLIPADEDAEESEDDGIWTSPVSKTYHFKDYISEQIRSRYAFLDRPTNGLSNVVMDTYLPRYLYKHKMNSEAIHYSENIPSTAISISHLSAKILGTKRMETEQLCRILGFAKKDIKSLMLRVKAKQLNFVFVGAGGTGMNTAYWLSEFAEMTNTISLFKSVYVFDEDKIEISNMLRFPMDIYAAEGYSNITGSKLNLIKPFTDKISKSESILSTSRMACEPISEYTIQKYPMIIFDTNSTINDDGKKIYEAKTNPKFVLYGAPDLETRQNLSTCGSFISATHADSGCSMYMNPSQDLGLQVESYGMIQLSSFFMNQARMTIELLNILADPELNLSEQNKELFKFSFDGERKMTTDRTYQFQISKEVNMLTEEESVNI